MRCRDGVKFSVACLLMATFIGITGFVIVYHYVRFERPLQKFAIVIDAGSTQTRSGLFSISVNVPKLADLADEAIENDEAYELNIVDECISGTRTNSKRTKPPLSKLLSVSQVGSCVNGGPLASVKTESGAQELVSQCLVKFSNQIKHLETDTTDSDEDDAENQENARNDHNSLARTDSGDLSKKYAQANNRVNSLTHLYMGATAGMRALKELDEQEANQIVRWVNQAVNNINQGRGPHINKGSVGILEGDDEAKFTWISVNFVCERLSLKLKPDSAAELLAGANPADYYLSTGNLNGGETSDNQRSEEDWSSTGIRQRQELERYARRLRQASESGDVLNTVGTVELGGASAQIAYRVPSWLTGDQVANNSLVGQSFDLFNEKYAIGTRSDLCLGASQAVLRVEYLLMRELFGRISQTRGSLELLEEIENPCLQNGSRKSFDSKQLLEALKAPCLVPSKSTKIQVQQVRDILTARANTEQQASRGTMRFFGTGDTKKCGLLLSKLLDLDECRQTFSICPAGSGLRGTGPQKLIEPPSTMPFVTIAGYNKALQVLKLSKSDSEIVESETKQVVELEQLISEQLGGHSIDYLELVAKTEEFCRTKISELASKYPLVNSRLIETTCLSLQYIEKILTNYYHFEPKTSWKQLKFLLFPPRSSTNSKKQQTEVSANDIGWTLGLLLNATSQLQFQPMFQSAIGGSGGDSPIIFHHHKASSVIVLKTAVFLMIASVLLALSILLVAVLAIKHKNCQDSSSSSSTYNAQNQQEGVYLTHSYGGISVVSSEY